MGTWGVQLIRMEYAMAETKFIRTTGVHLTFTVEQDDLLIPHQRR